MSHQEIFFTFFTNNSTDVQSYPKVSITLSVSITASFFQTVFNGMSIKDERKDGNYKQIRERKETEHLHKNVKTRQMNRMGHL